MAAINWSFGFSYNAIFCVITSPVINRSAQSSTDIFSKLKVRGSLFNRSNLNANTKTMIKARAEPN